MSHKSIKQSSSYKPVNTPPQANKKDSLVKVLKKIPSLPIFLLLFVCYWVYCSFIYGDVFYITEQFSFLAFDKVLMKEVFAVSGSWLILTGRFVLLFFKYPILGGLIYALILTAISVLINYVFNLKNYYRIISFLPLVWLAAITNIGLNVFYEYEPSFVGSYPVVALIVLGIAAIGIKIIKKRPFLASIADFKSDKKEFNGLNVVALVVLFGGLVYYTNIYAQNTAYTAKMQRMLQKEQFEDMIELGRKAKQPSRPVACYYAIALVQTDQLVEKMFDIYYQFPNIKMVNRTGSPDVGNFMYEPDADFYSGLVNSSYHFNMEHAVSSGVTVYRLKLMFLAALVNHETNLAYRYINILDAVPFEQEFVKKYKPMLYDRTLLKNDPVLAKVMNMLPRENAFEEQFETPVFIGYYKGVTTGSKRTMLNSIAASLYTKDIKDFMDIMQIFDNSASVPPTFMDALTVYAMQSNDAEMMQSLPTYYTNSTREMMEDARTLQTEDIRQKGSVLKNKYTGKYSFYYFFQNIPDENYATPTTPGEAPAQQQTAGENKVN